MTSELSRLGIDKLGGRSIVNLLSVRAEVPAIHPVPLQHTADVETDRKLQLQRKLAEAESEGESRLSEIEGQLAAVETEIAAAEIEIRDERRSKHRLLAPRSAGFTDADLDF